VALCRYQAREERARKAVALGSPEKYKVASSKVDIYEFSMGVSAVFDPPFYSLRIWYRFS